MVTIKATKDKFTTRERAFETIGYDILLDEEINPWLIEANSSPAMSYSTVIL